MRHAQIIAAWFVCVCGMFMPWRTRVLFSELLGWIAQLVPPQLYTLDPPPAGADEAGDLGSEGSTEPG